MKSFSPFIKDGIHQTFTGKSGTLYKFIVEFENGDTGEANSTKQIPSWIVGAEYTYTSETNQYGIRISGMKKADAAPYGGGGGGGSKWNQHPDKQKHMARQTSYKTSVEFFTLVDQSALPDAAQTQLAIESFAETLYNYMTEGNPAEHVQSFRGTAVMQAVQSMNITSLGVSSRDLVMTKAKVIEQWLLKYNQGSAQAATTPF